MQLHHVELYSGIGGMRLGVACVLPPHVKHICKAVDVNTISNQVYQHNFNDQPATQSLEYCSAADLAIGQQQLHTRQQEASPPAAANKDSRLPLLWTLSPPCQPYTRTTHSKQADAGDSRATSFSHIMGLLPTLQELPTHILLENVVSFYHSQSHQQLHEVLSTLGYQVFDVALCPSQLGIPHLRPRHYTLAKLQHSCSSNTSTIGFSQTVVQQLQVLQHGRDPQYIHWSANSCKGKSQKQQQQQQQPNFQLHPAAEELQEQGVPQLKQYLQLDWAQQVQPLSDSPAELQSQVARYALPLSTVARYFKLLDIVSPTMSSHSNCFTKGYGKSIMGTGSYLLEDAAVQQLASRDSRGRLHFMADPYAQQGCSGCSKHKAAAAETPSAGSTGSAAAAHVAVATLPARDASPEKPQPQPQMPDAPSSSTIAQLAQQQEPQAKRQCCEAIIAQQQKTISQPAGTTLPQQTWLEGQIPPVLRVRRFTPREVANLMGFPDWFHFPADITDRQAYALLGNSLSIDVVSYLVHLLLEDVIDGSCYAS